MPDSELKTEVAIVGGGMVGMALALSLAKHDISSLIFEAKPTSAETDEQFDDRTLVVNPASQLFWQDLGLWSEIEPNTTNIDRVHVSNQGHFGVVQFDKDELGVSELGHVVAAKTLAKVLLNAVEQHPLIQFLQPARLVEFKQAETHMCLSIKHADSIQQVTAQLMVGADGVQSSIRSELKLETVVKSYQRSAIVCNITTSQKHQNRAFERLTTDGPMALLPFSHASGEGRFGMVWSMLTTRVEELLTAESQIFIDQAQQQFGFRAGEFKRLGRRSSYPIYQIKVPIQYARRIVLMGNAAHAVSPVSAQGLNLAVRGIGRLSDQLKLAKQQGLDLGEDCVLKVYQQNSNEDQQRTLNYTDDLMTWFKIDEPVINVCRSVGLVAVNASLKLKRALYNTAGGLR